MSRREIVPQDRYVPAAWVIGVVAVAIRFISIDQPFIDRWSWRQSDVAAIARNYFTGGFHFAYPQVDWAGNAAGYVGTEFPILPFSAALAYRAIGVHDWIGRLESTLFFAISLPFFFLLVRRSLDLPSALWALIFYSFAPLSVMTSRCFMPDMPSLALSIVAIALFESWTTGENTIVLFVSALAMSLSVLIKVPSLVNGTALLYLAWHYHGWQMARDVRLWSYAAITLLPSAIWYWHAYRIAQKFYPHHFFGAGGFAIEPVQWYAHVAWQAITSGLTIILAVFFGLGVLLAFKTKRSRLFICWLGAMLLFVFLVGYGNRHPWYQLPFVPIAAALAGFAVQHVFGGTKTIPAISRMLVVPVAAVILLVFLCSSALALRRFYEPAAADLRRAGLALRQMTSPQDLIVAADYGDPTVFYYAERKGWHFTERDGIYDGHPLNDADAIADLERLRSTGGNYVVFYSGTLWWLDYYKEFAQFLEKNGVLKEANAQFRIYALK